MPTEPQKKLSQQQKAQAFLVGSVIVTALLYVIPGGRWIGYPLMLLSTLVHELGHGLMAVLCGGDFNSFRMNLDGSGVTSWAAAPSSLTRALVSAGGLVGPAIGAAIGFALSRKPKTAQIGLGLFAAFMALALILVVRGWFGMLFCAAVTAIAVAIVAKARPWASQITMVFVSVQLALSVFSRGDYLFTDKAVVGGRVLYSDVAQMADALFGPYWLWGVICGGLSVAVLVFGLRLFFKAERTA